MAEFPTGGSVGHRTAVPGVTCGRIRGYLNAVARGETPPEDAAVWAELAPRRAIAGSPARPDIVI